MSFHRQHGQAFTQSRPQSRRQSHSSSSFYHSPLRDIGGSQHGFEPDAASMIGQLPFEGLDLPLEYEPYPTLEQVQLWDHSSSVSPRQHVHPQRHQNVYDATPLPGGSSGKGKERVTQSPRSRVLSPMEGHESSDKKSQRRLQNRLSQRAYRTRKDKLIETLSLRIQDEIQSRKNMAEACSRKIDACISVFNTQIGELRALQNTLLTDASAHADTGREHGQRDEREVSMDPGEGTVGMGFEFDAGAWGYQF